MTLENNAFSMGQIGKDAIEIKYCFVVVLYLRQLKLYLALECNVNFSVLTRLEFEAQLNFKVNEKNMH